LGEKMPGRIPTVMFLKKIEMDESIMLREDCQLPSLG
jgi:hypothetical protein